MIKQCTQCKTSFEITDEDLKYYDKISPIFAGKKYLIPEPSMCPSCRQQRRLCFRNERKLYPRKCDLCQKSIITVTALDKSYPVYCSDCWWGDKWDAINYGLDIDFTKDFFSQFKELYDKVPKLAATVSNSINSEYNNYIVGCKNCYMLISARAEDSMYGRKILGSRSCIDCMNINDCENCYEMIHSDNCYNCSFIEYSRNCSDSKFLYNCNSCKDCILCSNLNNKQYCISNQQLTKDEYEKKKLEMNIDSFTNIKILKGKFDSLKYSTIRKSNNNVKSDDCYGDNLLNCSKCSHCFELANHENCKFSIDAVGKAKDCMDCDICSINIELLYDCVSTSMDSYNCKFCVNSHSIKDAIYSIDCFNQCEDIFGCVGLKNHNKYCILNKEYTKEEYETLVPKIIENMTLNHSAEASDSGHVQSISDEVNGSWGEFFDPRVSPYGYNETVAQDYFPLTREEALAKGFKWSDYNIDSNLNVAFYEPNDDVKYYQDENHVKELVSGILKCEVTGKPFRIIPQELAFYINHNIAIPRRCPEQRYLDRLALRNPRKIYERKCMKCEKDIKTTYSPERKEIVYCDRCYQDEVY